MLLNVLCLKIMSMIPSVIYVSKIHTVNYGLSIRVHLLVIAVEILPLYYIFTLKFCHNKSEFYTIEIKSFAIP